MSEPARAAPSDELQRRALLSLLEDQERHLRELRETRARMDEVLASIDEVIWSVDAATDRVLYISPAAERIYGRPVREFLDTPRLWEAVVEPADRAMAQGLYVETMSAGRAVREYRIRRPDGAVRWLRDSATLVPERDGRPARIDGVVSDITEQRQAREALVESEAQFRSMVEQNIAGFYIVQDGRLAYVNPRFAEILGYPDTQALTGREVREIVVPDDWEAVGKGLPERLGTEGASLAYTLSLIRRDGSTALIGAHAIGGTFRSRPAAFGLMQDITEKARAEAEIQRYVKELEGAFMRTVEVAMTISEMRDPYTSGHEKRVAAIAVEIGRELGFDERRLEGLRVSGFLHDIGKITIPAEFLSKPGRLSAAEFELVKGHAQAGYDVLKDVGFPWPVAQVAQQHHERIDGTGYPQGLKGIAILLEARIVAVADVVEAMSSHRPYRPGLGLERALEEIERGRGTAYDAAAADACLRIFRERGFQLPA